MAELRPLYIASTTPGMAWRIGSHKPANRAAYVIANEGRGSGDGCWSCDLMGCRKFRREVEGGRATRRALTDEVRLLLLEMHAAGVIARKEASPAAGFLEIAAA
jgi:hypothetical protein